MRDLVMPYAVVIAASAVPLITVRFIAARYFDLARDTWLLGLAWLGALVVALGSSVPLGLMLGAVLLHWRSWQQLPAVATWAGIAATFALALIAFAVYQRWRGDEVKALAGGRIVFAALLVLLWPHASPYEWPAYAIGLWLTSSWVAAVALVVAIVVLYPVTLPYALALVAVVVLAWTVPWTRRQLLDRTPRGSSLKQVRMRWRTDVAMLRVLARQPSRWWRGLGPMPAGRVGPSLERELEREAVRLSMRRREELPLNTAPSHCEPLELAATYGVLAVVAIAVLGAQLAQRIQLGDPWSATVVAGIALSCATITRAAPVGLVWLIALAVVLA
jgi:hypothetical protein